MTPADGAELSRNGIVGAVFTCDDADEGGSGIDTCIGDAADGSPIDTSTLGANTFTVTATDAAGNTSVAVHSYTVTDQTGPIVTITTPADGAVYDLNEIVTADFDCEEPAGLPAS